MSYVVCSNIPDDEDNLNREGGAIDDPFRFRNHLGSTFTIPKNAQVALESAKIQMDGSINVSGQQVLYQYFGKEIQAGADPTYAASLDLTTSEPIRTILDTQGAEALGPPDFIRTVASSCASNIYQPILRKGVSGAINQDAGGAFTGFTVEYEQGVSAVNDVPIPQSAVCHDRFAAVSRGGARAEVFSYSGNDRAGNPSPGNFYNIGAALGANATASATFNVGAISDKRGSFEVDIRNVVGDPAPGDQGVCQWFVGLGRPVVTRQNGNGRYMRPPDFSGNQTAMGGPADDDLAWFRGYADFGVFCTNDPASTKRNQLQVMHSVIDATRQGNATDFKASPFEYAEVGPVAGNDPLASNYDLEANASRIEFIKFEVDGEIVTIQGLDKSGGNTFDIVRYDATRNKELNLSATGQHRWNMVPILALNTQHTGGDERELIISEYTPVGGQETTLAKLNAKESYLWQNYINRRASVLTSNWQQSLILQGNETAVRSLAERAPLNYGVGLGAVNPYEYDFATDAGTDPLQPYAYRRMIWILGRSDEYGVREGSILSKRLGFLGRRVVVSETDATTGNFKFVSTTTPELVPSRSIFVRLDNFALASTNARQGGQSRIIAHLPRFSGNQSVGALYLQPANLIYVDLNNSEEIKVNSFDISLCYNDEKFVESLTGATIICLHFKEKGT